MELYTKFYNIFRDWQTSRHSMSIEESGRRMLFINFLLLLIIPLIIFGTIHLINGIYLYFTINYLLAIVFFLLVILLNRQKNAKLVYRVITVIFGIILFFWMKTGAINGYASLWILTFPLYAFFLMGKKEGFFWTAGYAIITILLFKNPYNLFSDFNYSPDYISRHLFTYFMIFLISYSYEAMRQRYKLAMEAEQAELVHEKNKLAETKNAVDKANRLLKDEMIEREKTEIELRRHRDRLEDIVAERTLELKMNNEKLEASEKRYRLMADNVNDLIWTTDLNLNFTFISPSVYKIYGYTVEEAMKLTPEKWNTSESVAKRLKYYQKASEYIDNNKPLLDGHLTIQLNQIKKDGTIFPAEIQASFIRDESGEKIGIVGITRDISERIAIEQERERIKEQLAQSQKLEALGTLVGGLAHDFNNFLSGIIGSFDLIALALKKENLDKKDYIEKYLNLGMESSKRSAGLINQLLILSKRHEVKLSPLDITYSINHIYELCRNSFPKSIEINFQIEKAPLVIMGDMVQIEQVLLNLCINASHAMTIMRRPEEKQGGVLTVNAEIVQYDHLIEETYTGASGIPDHWIRIKITDTGVGIENGTKQRIFEPFFSTKQESTGLGLAISYNIVKKHGGIMNVYSEPGTGSCFSVYFPVYYSIEKVPGKENRQEIIQGEGTILVIDDEHVILNIAEAFLLKAGYKVLAAEGADKGIEMYMKEHKNISAVLLDLSMPGKSGLEVFAELKKINPDVKVILSSGMLGSEARENAFRMGIRGTVNKPYLAAELSMKIKNVLNAD